MKNNLKILLPLYLLMAIVLLNSCGGDTVEIQKVNHKITELSLTKSQLKALKLQFATMEESELSIPIQANGMVEVPPQNKSYITCPYGGFIKSLNVLDGSVVRKGQVLFKIQHPDILQIQQDYLELMGSMDYLEAEAARQKTMYSQEAASIKNYQQAMANLNTAKAKKEGLLSKLNLANVEVSILNKGKIQAQQSIIAPFDGVVTKILANVGAYAAPTENLLEIIDLKHAHAEVLVYEKYLNSIKIGQKVKLTFVNNAQIMDASVFLIGREISKDRTVRLHCHFEGSHENLTPGAYFKAEIRADPKVYHTVPSEAIVSLGNKSAIFVRNQNGTFKPYYIKVLREFDQKAAIEFLNATLKPNDQVVVKGVFELLSLFVKMNENEG